MMKVLSIIISLAILYTNHAEADLEFITELSSSDAAVSLQIDGKHQGVGVIIGPRFVLTTWSLLKKLLESHSQQQINLIAGLGSGEPTISRGIEKINYYFDRYEVKPSSNNDKRPIHNIALILVSGEFDSRDNNFVATATMVEQGYRPKKDSNVALSGFNENLNWVKGEMSIVSSDNCASSYKAYNRTYFGEICAQESFPDQRPCKGDEGTPLYSQDMLVGIASWIAYCEDPSYPSVFVNIGDYRDWIEASMNIMLGIEPETYSDDLDENLGQKFLDWVLLDHNEPCEIGPKRLRIQYKDCYWRCRDHGAGYGKCPQDQCTCISNKGDFFLYNKINNIPKVDFTDLRCLEFGCQRSV